MRFVLLLTDFLRGNLKPFYHLKDDALNRIHKWTCQLKERGLAAPLDIYDTNKGHQDLSYCQIPYDPFDTQFLF